MTTLPMETDDKIKKIMKQYGKTKWEVIVMAIDEEYEKFLLVQDLLKNTKTPPKKS